MNSCLNCKNKAICVAYSGIRRMSKWKLGKLWILNAEAEVYEALANNYRLYKPIQKE